MTIDVVGHRPGRRVADRARIQERLIESFDHESKVAEAWLDKALSREEEIASGTRAKAALCV